MPRSATRLLPLLALLAATGASALHAQVVPRLARADFPLEGAGPGAFVPGGWKVARTVEGHLNGDSIPDRVLHLVTEETPDDRTGTDAAPESQALVILLAKRGGGFRRGGVAGTLLQSGVPQYSLDLRVQRGVLITEEDYGMSDVVQLRHRFRLDPASGRFVLIGRDTYSYQRPLSRDDTFRTSENYLTGVRITTTGHVEGGVVARESERRETIPRSRVFFEDVDVVTDG
ncbi:MAG TPA: hypothetical protein VHG91_21795 [Longimicrobium sp.]|nr:hypothetical protein [Longimicrobium sp.]